MTLNASAASSLILAIESLLAKQFFYQQYNEVKILSKSKQK